MDAEYWKSSHSDKYYGKKNQKMFDMNFSWILCGENCIFFAFSSPLLTRGFGSRPIFHWFFSISSKRLVPISISFSHFHRLKSIFSVFMRMQLIGEPKFHPFVWCEIVSTAHCTFHWETFFSKMAAISLFACTEHMKPFKSRFTHQQ